MKAMYKGSRLSIEHANRETYQTVEVKNWMIQNMKIDLFIERIEAHLLICFFYTSGQEARKAYGSHISNVCERRCVRNANYWKY